MPTFVKAQEYKNDYRFEVCDQPPDRCEHGSETQEHRSYTWPKDGNDMSEADMVREISLLEGLRTTSPAPIRTLSAEGRKLA